MFDYFMETYFFDMLLYIVLVVAGMIGAVCAKLYKRHVDSDEKAAVASYSMLYVENVFKTIHGEQKLRKALDTARVLLNKKGIKFDEKEMEILIEAAHCEFNDTFNKVRAESEKRTTMETGEDAETADDAETDIDDGWID